MAFAFRPGWASALWLLARLGRVGTGAALARRRRRETLAHRRARRPDWNSRRRQHRVRVARNAALRGGDFVPRVPADRDLGVRHATHGETERALYPSQWFVLAALFWFPWIYSTADSAAAGVSRCAAWCRRRLRGGSPATCSSSGSALVGLAADVLLPAETHRTSAAKPLPRAVRVLDLDSVRHVDRHSRRARRCRRGCRR